MTDKDKTKHTEDRQVLDPRRLHLEFEETLFKYSLQKLVQ